MRKIILTRGYSAVVSDEDYARINYYTWFASVGVQVRAARMEYRQMIYMHHQVLEIHPNTLSLEGKEIDHIDNNPLNNQKNNLRVVTHTENMLNTDRHKNRKGYCYNKRAGLWCIYLDRPYQKRKYFGYVRTEEEAIIKAMQVRDAHN